MNDICVAFAVCKSLVCETDKRAIEDALNSLFTCLHATIVSGSMLTALPRTRSEDSFSPVPHTERLPVCSLSRANHNAAKRVPLHNW